METEQNRASEATLSAYAPEELLRSRERIRELQDNVFGLRMSRRVLLSLLDEVQAVQQEEIERLLKQNDKLQKQNRSYAGRLMEQNRRILALEQRQNHENPC
jgi:hypothetical protein